jgi:hypothetical protein
VTVTGWWAFELLARSPSWLPWLRWVIAAMAAAAAGAMLAAGLSSRGARGVPVAPERAAGAGVTRGRALGVAGLALAVVAGLAGPLAYSIKTIAATHTGGMPTAGPTVAGAFRGLGALGETGSAGPASGRGGASEASEASEAPFGAGGLPFGGFAGFLAMAGGNRVNRALLALVTTGASKYTWVAATQGSMEAAPIELASGGDPVMAIGGFAGSDPAPTLGRFEAMVAAHEIHYYIGRGGGPFGTSRSPDHLSGLGDLTSLGDLGGFGGFGGFGGGPASTAIASWVTAHFTARSVGGTTVYDLTRPHHPRTGG